MPAGAEADIDEAVALEHEQRIADWRAGGREADGQIGFGEAIAGQHSEIGDIRQQIRVDALRRAGPWEILDVAIAAMLARRDGAGAS